MSLDAQRQGALFGLLAAASFGISAPVAKRLLGATGPLMMAGLLYLGAGLGLSLYRAATPRRDEAPLRRSDFTTLAAIALAGGVLGPVLMLVGLARVSGVVGSLLLNLEGAFTILLAVLVFGEHLGRRGALASALTLAGAVVLRFQPGSGAAADWLGIAALAGASLCWATDNNLTQRLTLRDPLALVRFKTLAAGTLNVALGAALGDRLPAPGTLAALLGLGLVSYGLSVLLDAWALRLVGAAREAAYFATAPFIGALVAVPVLGESLSAAEIGAAALMAAGVGLLIAERHSHRHRHEAVAHEHAHVHDEHHQHAHPEGVTVEPGHPHSHGHVHQPLDHEHPHVSDVHHRHGHD